MEPYTGLTIEEVDVDGTLQETAADAHGHTRADLLKKAGIAGGSLAASGVLLGGLPAAAAARGSSTTDIRILNFALTLEYLEAAFYKEARDGGKLSGRTLDFAKLVADHEATHVATLKKALGKRAIKSPTFDFKGTTMDQGKFQQTSLALENTGVRAYLGQAPIIKNPKYLVVAAEIVTIEARHAALIADIIGGDVKTATPNGSFDRRNSMKQILNQVGKTGFLKHYN